MNYVGIDPGLSGAIAVISDDNFICVSDLPPGKGYPEPIPTWALLRQIIADDENNHFAIEQTQTRPGQGVVAAHGYGIGYGVLLGCICSFNPKSFRTIGPKVWQKAIWAEFGAHGNIDDTKARTHQAMMRAWPDTKVQNWLVTARGKLLDGRCDALAIATWCRMVNK